MSPTRPTASAPVRALIYTRVSQDRTGRSRSVEQQQSECEAECDERGWSVIATLTENDRSASRYAKRGRPVWEQVKEQIAAGAVDVLVTWEASRGGRDLEEFTRLRRLCRDHGVRLAYSGKVYDLADPDDSHRAGSDALDAERESDKTSKRLRRATRAAARKGRPHGRRLYGYRRTYDERTGELLGQEPHPDEAPVIREAARRFLAGESARSIANDFNRRNIPTPYEGTWDLTRVRRILTNPGYAARRVHLGEVVGPADWPAILDDETFDALAVRFADPSRRSNRRAPTVRLLSGVARCGECGGPMRYAKQGGGDRKVRLTYACAGRHCTARDMAALEAYVVGVVLERLSLPDARAQLVGNQLSPAADAAAQEAAALRRRLDDATEEFNAGNLTAATLGRIEAALLPQIEAAIRSSRVAGLPTVAADIASSTDPGAMWDQLAPEQRREVIRAMLEVVVDRVTTRGRKAFDPTTIRIEWRH